MNCDSDAKIDNETHIKTLTFSNALHCLETGKLCSMQHNSTSQYGGYDPRLVTEWVRARIPSKAWLYLLRERSRSFACNGFPSRKESSAPLLVICCDHHLTDRRRRQLGIRQVQYVGVGGRHPSWHGRRTGKPRQQLRQASGGILPKSHVRCDEAYFWLNGYVNKQNCRIWSEANPQVHVETPLHPEKLTVWCALWVGGILLQKR
ncbi:hypothetical protein TNCV_4150141 [Trichonephila clavipes]|uniref:Transposase n=1 Tax=Trichonephila clavipes TaxID=2585209 RepID=A0A8X6W5C7_TRICX|nr:hypothetical protein TNCV_4150141 [Trichonephila clavipes]